MPALSKSKIIAFRQCPKRLWLEVHHPELKEDSAKTQASYQMGHSVGEIARQIYDLPGTAALIDAQQEGYKAAFERSAVLLKEGEAPIFETGFQTKDSLAFADVMIPIPGKGGTTWKMIEVKSSTKIKDYHRDDVAVQTRIATEMGVKLSAIAIAHVDNSWVYRKLGNYQGLLLENDLTAEALERSKEAKGWIKDALATAALAEEPKVETGDHCFDPFECGFCNYCNRGKVEPDFPVSWFPRLTARQRGELVALGVDDMRQVPDGLLTPKQSQVQEHTVNGTVFFDVKQARASLSRCGFPAYFLDFETTNPAVPMWIGSRPYQQIPFQFSVHSVSKDLQLQHSEFLDVSGNDPRRGIAEALIKSCGTRGPVFAYNASFEAGVIRTLAKQFSDLEQNLDAINDRMVDLLPVAEKCFYHPSQQGSWSIKKVLPAAVPELSYDSLPGVRDGGMAMEAYAEAIQPNAAPERKEQIRQELLAYCRLDTLAMVGLWKFFLGRESPALV